MVRRKFNTGGVVDYSQGSQLLNLLGQYINMQGSSEGISNVNEFTNEEIEEEDTLLNEEIEEEDTLLNEEELESPETSLFGEDFLNDTVMMLPRSQNLYLDEANITNPTITPSGDVNSYIVAKESGGRYDALPLDKNGNLASSAVGKYQFLWNTWGKDIMRVTGVKSKEEFRNNPQAQEDFYSHYSKTTLAPQAKKYLPKVKKYFPNANEDMVKTMIHFAGAGNLEQAIKTGDFGKPLDKFGSSILSYITPNKQNMSKKKYAGGGEVWGQAAKGAADLAPLVMGIIDSMNTGYSNQPVVTARQSAQFNPYSKDYGNQSLPMFAMGGQVPIEAEGEEMIETPNGQVGELKGPSHEQGGIDMNVPQGTKIYSDRIAIDGKTMADRKKNREKAISRLEKLSAKNPKDKLLLNSLQRTKEVMDMEEAQDMQIQKAASPMTQGKFAFGTDELGVGEPIDLNLDEDYINPWTLPNNSIDDYDPNKSRPKVQSIGVNPMVYSAPISTPTPTNVQPMSGTTSTEGDNNKSATEATVGDYVGMAGNLFNAFAPLLNTLANRRGDKPNVNHYKNFGKDALDANQKSQDYVASQRENALTALRQQMNSSKASNRDGARSINTVRALDMATDLGYSKGMNSVYDAFSQQMMGLLGQQSQLENQQDLSVMKGDGDRAERDVRDRDNYHTQLGENLTNLGTNVQGMGRNLNTMQSNKDMNSLIAQLSQYGLGFVRDGKGNMVLSKIK